MILEIGKQGTVGPLTLRSAHFETHPTIINLSNAQLI